MAQKHFQLHALDLSGRRLLPPGHQILLLTAGGGAAQRKRGSERKSPPLPKKPPPPNPEVSDISQRDLHEVDPRDPAATRPEMEVPPPKGGPPRTTKR